MAFNGFSKKTIKFFKDLEKNNSKQWFADHKDEYEKYVKEPSVDFVIEMGPKLQKLSPYFNAVPKVNQSLFKIHRDTRFSKDKSPFKTNLGIWFWEGDKKRMECSGFYFHLENGKIMIGAGIYMFSKETLKTYRDAIIDKKHGPAFKKAVTAVLKRGYNIGGKNYKKVPRGFDADHENAEFLLYNGLYAGIETKIPNEFYTKDILGYSFNHYKKMLPVHEWLRDIL